MQLVVGFVCSEVEVLVEQEQHVAVGEVRWSHVGLQVAIRDGFLGIRTAQSEFLTVADDGVGWYLVVYHGKNPITPKTTGIFIYLNIPRSLRNSIQYLAPLPPPHCLS